MASNPPTSTIPFNFATAAPAPQASPPQPGSAAAPVQPQVTPVSPDIGLTPTQPLPSLAPYQRLQQYYRPLEQDPQLATPQLDPATFEMVQRALQAQKPVQKPHPASQQVRPSLPSDQNRALKILGEAGHQIWDQQIGGLIDTWHRDWKAGLAETAGVAAVAALVIGAEVATGGAATPVILGIGAALALPGLLDAATQEMTNPTDQNTVKLLVNAANVGLVATPTRSLGLAGRARQVFEGETQARKDLASGEQLLEVLNPNLKRQVSVNMHDLIQEQLPMLERSPEAIQAQLKSLPGAVEVDSKDVRNLIQYSQQAEDLQRLIASLPEGDPERAARLVELNSLARTQLGPSRRQIAGQYGLLAENPYQHIPIGLSEEEAALAPSVTDKVDQQTRLGLGLLQQGALGRGVSAMHEHILEPAQELERQALVTAAGGTDNSVTLWLGSIQDMFKAAGRNADTDLEGVLQALEEPGKWEALSPTDKYLTRQMRLQLNAMTLGEARMGTRPAVIPGYVPHLERGTLPAQTFVRFWTNRHLDVPGQWKLASDLGSGELEYGRIQNRAEILASKTAQDTTFTAAAPARAAYAAHGPEIEQFQASRTRIKAAATRYRWPEERLVERLGQHTEDFKSSLGDSEHVTQALDLAEKKSSQVAREVTVSPQQRELLQGADLLRTLGWGYFKRMEAAHSYEGLASFAHTGEQTLKGLLGPVKEPDVGLAIHHASFVNKSELPLVAPGNFFKHGVPNEYLQVHAGFGTEGDLNYRPPLYMLKETAEPILKAAEDARTGADWNAGVMKNVFGLARGSKRFIMMSPAIHFMNVTGRLLGFLEQDPMTAGKALKSIHLMDPELRGQLEGRFAQAGGVHINRFNSGQHVASLMKNDSAQTTFPAMRSAIGQLMHPYTDGLERGFWNMVHDFQLSAFDTAVARLKATRADLGDQKIDMLAAHYANDLAGAVNPLYMNKLYRQARNLIWFAPAYWASLGHTVAMSMPGTSRLAAAIAKFQDGRYVRWTGLPMKTIDLVARQELMRMQRGWLGSYLMASVVAADLMNTLFSGHHLWDNEPGHEFDLEVSKLVADDKKTGKRAYVSGIPFFKQGSDVMNALGFGHDWGLAHQVSDPAWQQADGVHKGQLMLGALAQGLEHEGSTKLAPVSQVGYAAATGESLTGRLRGQQQEIKGPLGRFSDLVSFLPAGYSIERYMADVTDVANKYPPGSPEYKQAMQQAQQQQGEQIWQGLRYSLLGWPSPYHVGPEKPPVDDSKMQNYYKQRNQVHSDLSRASTSVFQGKMSPLEYAQFKHSETDKLLQLEADTFGVSSPSGQISALRSKLEKDYQLNDKAISNEEWFSRYDAFQASFEQVLESANPDVRASWWDAYTANWTDADYLSWEAKQLKQSLQAAVDHQGGAYIRAYQQQMYQVLARYPGDTQLKTELEQQDPYYYTYLQLLKQMSKTSALGAFISAFSSPHSTTVVLPPGMSDEQLAQWQQQVGSQEVGVRSETAQRLAQEARGVAHEPGVRQAGGEPLQSQAYRQQEEQAIAAAEEAAKQNA